MTRLLSRPHRAIQPPDASTATTLPVPPTPVAPLPANGQVTKQLQGSIQQFLRQERFFSAAMYAVVALILLTLVLIVGFNYQRTPSHAAASTAHAIIPPPETTVPTPPIGGTPTHGSDAATATVVASPSATAVSVKSPEQRPTPTVATAPTATPLPTATATPQIVLAIDAGAAVGDGTYQSDADYDGGKVVATTHAIDTSLVGNIAPTTVWQSARVGTSLTGTSFTYTFRQLAANTSYTIQLGFAEIDGTVTGVGQRAFDVTSNNQPVLTNFDIIAQAGAPYKAIAQSFTTTTDATGQISLVFSAGKAGVAIVNSITIATTAPTDG